MASTLSYSFLKRRRVTFDYKFITEPDDTLKCCICLEVARGPKQEEGHGKLFCSDCIQEWTCVLTVEITNHNTSVTNKVSNTTFMSGHMYLARCPMFIRS